jgi:hypothetical protein
VTRAEVDAAIARIHRRHADIDDPRRSALSDDPAEVLEYLTRNSTLLPQYVIGADTLDGLVLHTWLWWQDRRRERALLRRGEQAGLYLREMGGPLGVHTHQGVRARLDRLNALLAYERPDEHLSRELRRIDARAGERDTWGATHGPRVRRVIERLLTQLSRVPELAPALVPSADSPPPGESSTEPSVAAASALAEAAEWIVELRADQEKNSYSPATLGVLGLALAPLRLAITSMQLEPSHGMWRAIREADVLRSALSQS